MKMSGLGFKALPKLEELKPGLKAVGYKMLLLPCEIEETTKSGLVIAKTIDGNIKREEEAGSEGLVVSMGMMAGHERWEPGAIKPGDRVVFARYSGKASEFDGVDGRTYRIMNDEDVLGVRERADAIAAKVAA